MDMAYIYLIIGCCVLAFFISGILADRHALRKHYKINLDRYNFVVGIALILYIYIQNLEII